MKKEWRKHEKSLYLPKEKPETVIVPSMKFAVVSGSGSPGGDDFVEAVEALYSISYGIKMSNKKGDAPKEYTDYTVYPLEGVWDLNEEGRKKYLENDGIIDKSNLVYDLMIRQPDFVTDEFFKRILEQVEKKKPNPKLKNAKLVEIEEGQCVQILHVGSYDDENRSFEVMENYCTKNNLSRTEKMHREIYLSDARKVTPEKLKTVLRVKVR